MIIKQNACFILFVFFCFFNGGAQINIMGTVTDLNASPIAKASVVLFGEDQNIKAYAYTNDKGNFKITVQDQDTENFILAVNSLGFEEQRKTLNITSENKEYTVLFNLIEKAEQLNEVVLKSSQKISANGNVTTLKTKPFTDNTEQTVEDVLKKLPGVEVLNDGSIKAHGKFIDKLMIDGEDLFASNYQLLSKNLDTKTLEAVQILDKYQDNPVLAKILDSDHVALNLQVKDKFKNIWFGNVTGGLGTYERVKAAANIGLLRKKIKFFYFGDYNNLGNKAADQLIGAPSSLYLTTAYQEREIEPKINSVYSINTNENNLFKEGQSTFNKAFLKTLGFVTKVVPHLEMRGTGSFSNDIQNQLFSSETIYNIEQNPVRFSENSDTRHTNSIGSGELELKYTGGERSYLKNKFIYRNQPEYFDNGLLFNGTQITQDLHKKEHSFYNHLNYSYVLGKDKVLHNYIYLGENRVKQNTLIQSPFLNGLLNAPSNSQINQLSDDKLNVYGIQTNLFSKFGDFKHTLEVGYEYLKENRSNTFIKEANTTPSEIDSLQNKLHFEQKKLKLKTSLRYSFSEKVKLSLGLSVDYVSIDTGRGQQDDWLFNPEITLDMRELKVGEFSFNYRNAYTTPESTFFLDNYQLAGYRSFIRGTDENRLIKRNLYGFRYKWANELESQSVTLTGQYAASNGSYTTSNQINQDFIFSSYQFINGGNRISGNLDFTSYFEGLNLSTNLRTTQNWSTLPLQANSSGFGTLRNYSASYLLSGTTYFKLPINFTFKINTNQSRSDFNDVRSSTHWENGTLNITYKFSEELNASVNNDLYKTPNSSYYFLESTIDYQPKDSDFSFRLLVNNLTNEDNFSNVSISDYTTYRSSIRLIPRYILLSAKYRF